MTTDKEHQKYLQRKQKIAPLSYLTNLFGEDLPVTYPTPIPQSRIGKETGSVWYLRTLIGIST